MINRIRIEEENKRAINQTIQSLRALAVLAVLGFHFRIPGFHFGFLGVDAFFVISGFVIYNKISSKRTLADVFQYYLSRLKRIVPTYSLVILSVVTLSLQYGGSDQLSAILNEAKAALSFTSNYYYYFNTGYFDQNALYQPLLHLWSLAVEMQFYFIFPIAIFLGVLSDKKKLIGIILTSFVVSKIIFEYIGSSFHFYDFTSRLWQFLVGAFVALIVKNRESNTWVLLSITFLMVTAIIDPKIIAIAFTGTVIYLSEMKLIRFEKLSKIGDISYELYLWHWPLISLYSAKYGFPGTEQTIILILATFGISILSHKMVSLIVGRGKWWEIFMPYLLSVALLTSLSFGILESGKANLNSRQKAFIESNTSGTIGGGFTKCNLSNEFQEIEGFCQESGNKKSSVVTLLWGDSTAESWAHAFEVSKKKATHIILFSIPACAPFLDSYRSDSSFGTEWCKVPKLQNSIFQFVKEKKPESLYLIARWSLYTEGLLKNGKVIESKYYTMRNGEATRDSTFESFKYSASQFANLLPGTKISIFQDPRILKFTTIQALNDSVSASNLRIPTEPITYIGKLTRELISKIAQNYNWELIQADNLLCDKNTCTAINGGHVYYLDSVHVSAFAAEILGRVIK